MKYMGSKRLMLKNGLGQLLKKELVGTSRFFDAFTGSGSVAMHVAENYDIQVQAFDLQKYSSTMAAAILERIEKFDWQSQWVIWYKKAKKIYDSYNVPLTSKLTQSIVFDIRMWCAKQNNLPVTKAYGGHYFSASQTVWIDALRLSLPKESKIKMAALSALIQAASKCAAAPGHTAQPFQPTRSAKRFLLDAWNQDIVQHIKNAFESISNRCSKIEGVAKVANANEIVNQLNDNDLVFIDTPYSGVHYSRFYHVLETIAQGKCGEVTGVGRYPDPKKRPRSKYSLKSESKVALDELLKKISAKKAKAIITFPDHDCSNGLSGNIVRETASKYFSLDEHLVKSRFSTLGGKSNGGKKEAGRKARQSANELILVLKPK